jgi:glutamate dehydrogenase/leucine dehydrogenase
MFEDLLRDWDGEETVVRFDAPTGTWMFVGVHSTRLGPAFGGTRMRVYDRPGDGLADVMKLAGAMTSKQAMAGVPFGGGKAVLAVPSIPNGQDRRGMMLRYGELVGSLGGTYITACDMNTSPVDMDVIGERTEHVYGRTEAHGGSGSSAPDTALGVLHGIRASVAHALGSPSLEGRTVAVQGTGGVGGPLVEDLVAGGATVTVADVDPARARALAERFSGSVTVADVERIAEVPADVFAPCAVGGILTADLVGRLGCRIVAGAANNQLASPDVAEQLRQAGILYAPDFVINAGGVIHLAVLEASRGSRDEVDRRLEGIGDTLLEIYRLADAEGISTGRAAEQLAAERIAAAPPAMAIG